MKADRLSITPAALDDPTRRAILRQLSDLALPLADERRQEER
jgi:hypothetical protein